MSIDMSNVCGVCGGLKGPATREFVDHFLLYSKVEPGENPIILQGVYMPS